LYERLQAIKIGDAEKISISLDLILPLNIISICVADKSAFDNWTDNAKT
jgi:hypothetical protein